MKINLKNKKTLVIGGAGRIGLSISNSIIESGGTPIIVDRNKDAFERSSHNLKKEKYSFLEGDISTHKCIKKIIYESLSLHKKIDSAVYCAYPKSKGWGTNIEELQENNLRNDLYLQLGAPILFAKEILEYFSKNNGGNLINLSSIQGVCSPKFEHYQDTKMTSPIEYSGMKAGIISITKWLAKYYSNKNIRVNCISPGGIEDAQQDEFKNRYRNSCTNKGLLDSKDVSSLAIFLLSDYSYAINGQNIIVDDGWSL